MRIKEMWDAEEETPIYLGEERDQWIIGLEGLNDYFNPPSENTMVETVLLGRSYLPPSEAAGA